MLLDDPGAECHLRGLYVTAGEQHIDNYLNIDHARPHCTSRLYYKGILDDRSRAVFGGTVLVREGADQDGCPPGGQEPPPFREAEVDSKPTLEIYADDVKCGHGATAGAIAEDAIFYLQSRGLDADTAQEFLVKGFAAEILDEVTIEPLHAYLERAHHAGAAAIPAGRGYRVTSATTAHPEGSMDERFRRRRRLRMRSRGAPQENPG